MSTWTLLARMPDRSIGAVLRGASFKITLRLNEVGSWELSIPRDLTPAGWPTAGSGVVFLRDERPVASGNWDEETFTWSADASNDAAGQGLYSLSGDTDLGRLAYRLVYPTFTQGWTTQTNNYYVDSGQGENVLRNYVNRQAGSVALATRRVPGLALGAAVGVGNTISVRERFTPLLDAMRTAAIAAGGLVFDVVDDLAGTQRFVVWEPQDKTGTARFGVELGNATDLEVRRSAPVATDALVAGTEELVQRQTYEQHDSTADAAWGRREIFVDQRQASDPSNPTPTVPSAEQLATYQQAATEALQDNGEQISASVTALDTPLLQWGRDYRIGDKVSILTPFGPVTDLVRQVDISVDATGVESISSSIGSSDLRTDDPLAAAYRKLERRLSQIERAK